MVCVCRISIILLRKLIIQAVKIDYHLTRAAPPGIHQKNWLL